MNEGIKIQLEKGEKHISYKDKILKIVNDIETKARIVEPDQLLHRELHEKKAMDTNREVKEFESVRKDVCSTFGVHEDDEHVFIYQQKIEGAIEQRALRAFFVLIDTVHGQSFYGEGRIDHNTLFRKLVDLLGKYDPKADFDTIVDGMDKNPPRYLVFKGFISIKNFSEISDSSRKVLEMPILDEEGNRIDTASDWFITGHSLPETAI